MTNEKSWACGALVLALLAGGTPRDGHAFDGGICEYGFDTGVSARLYEGTDRMAYSMAPQQLRFGRFFSEAISLEIPLALAYTDSRRETFQEIVENRTAYSASLGLDVSLHAASAEGGGVYLSGGPAVEWIRDDGAARKQVSVGFGVGIKRPFADDAGAWRVFVRGERLFAGDGLASAWVARLGLGLSLLHGGK